MLKNTLLCAAVMAMALLAMGPAQAVFVDYTVSGWGPTSYPGPHLPPPGAPHDSYPGDTVEFRTYTGTLDLTPGTSTHQINTLLWTVDWTYNGTDDDPNNDGPPPGDWPELQFVITAPRTISIGSGSGTLNQTGLLRSNWDYDYLGLSAGPTVSIFDWANNSRIDVTPLALPEVKLNNWSGDPPWAQYDRNVMAQFTVTAIPEPISMVMLGCLGAGMAAARKLRRKK